MMQTKAAVLTAPGNLEITTRELELGEDEVLVKCHLTGICGSDKSIYKGDLPPNITLPFYIGHESGGTVIAVGSKVREYKPGDRVMVFNWCNAFAEYYKVPVTGLQPAPAGLDPDIAALGEPVACAMYSALTCGAQLGDTVVVYGMGFAGQIIAQAVKAMGAYRVIAVDVAPGKLELAKKLGSDIIINAALEDPVQAVLDLTDGVGADVVVEAAGSEKSMNQATAMLKHNGILALYSWITQPVTLNIGRWHDDALEIRTTCLVHHTREQRYIWTPWALRPVIQGQIDVRSLITHEFPLDRIAEAFAVAVQDPGAIKVVVRP
ncbi:putative zinc-type alcohol dehydrogenase-like protein YdjJ [Moorella humiferrea]|uniref:zinc-dependent alcohol dehydrogenase n=1 Tax=Neomoorella humiferrea TaxID=676965 RepID=UPI0030D4EC87